MIPFYTTIFILWFDKCLLATILPYFLLIQSIQIFDETAKHNAVITSVPLHIFSEFNETGTEFRRWVMMLKFDCWLMTHTHIVIASFMGPFSIPFCLFINNKPVVNRIT